MVYGIVEFFFSLGDQGDSSVSAVSPMWTPVLNRKTDNLQFHWWSNHNLAIINLLVAFGDLLSGSQLHSPIYVDICITTRPSVRFSPIHNSPPWSVKCQATFSATIVIEPRSKTPLLTINIIGGVELPRQSIDSLS